MTTDNRGFSFAEVVVASAIVSLLGLIGFYLTQFGTMSSRRMDSENDAFRQGTQAIARIRRELRGAEILQPTTSESGNEEGSEVLFRYPEMDGESLKVDETGHSVWAGVAKVSVDQGVLWLTKPIDSEPRQLARLGQGQLTARVDDQFITIGITVDLGKPEARFQRDFRLAQ